MKSDGELLKEFVRGNIESYETIVSRYKNRLLTLAARILRDAVTAEDVVQDVFVTLFRKAASVRNVRSWLYTCTVNRAKDALRSRRIPMNMESDVQSSACRSLMDALSEIPIDLRTAFLLTEGEGMTSAEASEILGISPELVRVHVHKARQVLRERLKNFFKVTP